MDDRLDPVHLLETIKAVCPAAQDGQVAGTDGGGGDGRIDSPVQALAILTHAIMTLLEFRVQIKGTDGSGGGLRGNQLPSHWNKEETLSFTYSHDRSSLRYLVKILNLGERVMVVASAVVSGGGARPVQFDVETTDYCSASFWPWPRQADDSRGQSGTDRSNENLVHGYIGPSRMRDFTAMFKNKIIATLMPDLFAKEGLDTSNRDSGTSGSASRPRPAPSPAGPSRQRYSDDDDDGPFGRAPYRGPLSTGPFQPPARGPFSIGDRDLDPLGGMAPFPPYGGLGRRDPTDPFGMGSGSRGGFGGGGMHPTPDHPMFRQPPGGRRPDYGIGDDDYTLPRGSVPPGARYDPIAPQSHWQRGNTRGQQGINRNPERGPIGWGDDGQIGGNNRSQSGPSHGPDMFTDDQIEGSGAGAGHGAGIPPPPDGYNDMYS